MSSLTTHTATSENIKLLMVGDPGGGKTGALASLANAGYNLRILDYDAGAVDVLRTYVEPKFWPNIDIVVLADKMKAQGPMMVPVGVPTAFAQGLALLTHWRYVENGDGTIRTKLKPGEEPDVDFGPLESWTAKDILIIDSFSHMGDAALKYVLKLNNRYTADARGQVTQPNWGEAQRMLMGVLDTLEAPDIHCQVIVNTHITMIQKTDDDGKAIAGIPLKAFPMALGQALSPKVGSYFNTMLLCSSHGRGTLAKREIKLHPEQFLELKIPAKDIPKSLPIETGLLEVFNLILKGGKTNAS